MAITQDRTDMTTTDDERPKGKRGFASMDVARQREIASKGGKAAHAQGHAHEFTVVEARLAGRKGGETVSRDRSHMAAIGRAGGQARGRNRAAKDRDTGPATAGSQ
jgi:general stress protein YciG